MDRIEIHGDFETRSTVDLKKTGLYVYAEDPTTDVWCFCWCIGDGPVQTWRPGESVPEALVDALAAGAIFYGHNVGFEHAIWMQILVPRYGWPPLPFEQCRCTAAQAAAMALPRDLGGAAMAMGLDVNKDQAGKRLMLTMAKPRRIEGGEPVWWDVPDRIERLIAYCEQDVVVERALTKKLRPLSDFEQAMFELDHEINTRGVRIDLKSVRNADVIVKKALLTLNEEMATRTRNAVGAATQVARLTEWVRSQGLEIDSLDKQGINTALKQAGEGTNLRRVLEIRQEAAKSSTAKLEAMKLRACRDGRARENLMYHGASTGRWSGKGIQLQNLPRPNLKQKDIDGAFEVFRSQDPAWLELWGRPLSVVSDCLRGMVVADPGNELVMADFSAIEGRVLAWLAGEEWKLQAFRDYDAGTGPGIYELTAARILGIPVEDVTPAQRQAQGKVPELFLGYGGGKGAFISGAAVYGLEVDEDHAEATKVQYRGANPKTVEFWYDLDRAAMSAVKHPGRKFDAGPISYAVKGGIMWCRLPSGRLLSYVDPKIQEVETPWGAMRDSVTYMGVDSVTRKWSRHKGYGGHWAENCLAGDSRVLTDRGWVQLQNVQREDRVWDGVEWVGHFGVCSVISPLPTIAVDGVRMTGDHRVLTTEGWRNASSCEGLDRAEVRLPEGDVVRGVGRAQVNLERSLRLRDGEDVGGLRAAEGSGELLRLHAQGLGRRSEPDAWDVASRGVRGLVVDGRPLHPALAQSVEELRRPGDHCMPGVACELRSVLGGYGPDVREGPDTGSRGQRAGVLESELPMGDLADAGAEQEICGVHRDAAGAAERGGSFAPVRGQRDDYILPDKGRVAGAALTLRPGLHEQVFDLMNCGPRSRFTVLGHHGPMIVHNCTQAVARDIMAEAMLRVEQRGWPVVLTCHDEVISEVPEGTVTSAEYEAEMCVLPSWAAGLPVAAAGDVSRRYKK